MKRITHAPPNNLCQPLHRRGGVSSDWRPNRLRPPACFPAASAVANALFAANHGDPQMRRSSDRPFHSWPLVPTAMTHEPLGHSRATPVQRMIPILENVAIARDTFRLRLGNAEIASTIRPGQFVMIRPGPAGATDPLLARPLALYDVVSDSSGVPSAFDVVYLVVGRGTATLALRRPGEQLAVWGPLGNGFGPPPAGPVVFVAGGIGQTPFLALGRSWLRPECRDQTHLAVAWSPRKTRRHSRQLLFHHP